VNREANELGFGESIRYETVSFLVDIHVRALSCLTLVAPFCFHMRIDSLGYILNDVVTDTLGTLLILSYSMFQYLFEKLIQTKLDSLLIFSLIPFSNSLWIYRQCMIKKKI
jgi:hypothetical protein